MSTLTKTKTGIKTTTQVFVAVIAVTMLGLAAIGYGYGFQRFNKIFSSSESSSPQSAKPVSTAKPTAGNRPIFKSAMTLKESKYGVTETQWLLSKASNFAGSVILLPVNVSPLLKDPKQYGQVTIKQLAFKVSATTGVKLSHFYLDGFEGSPAKTAVTAYRLGDVKKVIYHVGKNDLESIISSPAPGEIYDDFVIIVTAEDGEFKLGTMDTVKLVASVDAKDATPFFKEKIMRLSTKLMTNTSSEDIGGFLLNNRKYSDNKIFPTPADPNLYYILQSANPVESDPANPKPDYLWWCPSIFSDGGSLLHKSTSGNIGGSNDWFCLNDEDQKVYEHHVYIIKEQ